jgi:hypothetical protein
MLIERARSQENKYFNNQSNYIILNLSYLFLMILKDCFCLCV